MINKNIQFCDEILNKFLLVLVIQQCCFFKKIYWCAKLKIKMQTLKKTLSNSDIVFFLPFSEITNVYSTILGMLMDSIFQWKIVWSIPWFGMWLCAHELDLTNQLWMHSLFMHRSTYDLKSCWGYLWCS